VSRAVPRGAGRDRRPRDPLTGGRRRARRSLEPQAPQAPRRGHRPSDGRHTPPAPLAGARRPAPPI